MVRNKITRNATCTVHQVEVRLYYINFKCFSVGLIKSFRTQTSALTLNPAYIGTPRCLNVFLFGPGFLMLQIRNIVLCIFVIHIRSQKFILHAYIRLYLHIYYAFT